ncbi:hypothetical protein PROFUN_02567 [Planoprotostelium fungivorum]|uniref:Uncharacterized protein n=1 Tax=Planoprotostelium fungivorum TaxID=1890364 RepID=A0A2P6MPA9_9EUKA|nr:hypothetical protein PROFUN_02567 [Planoprotostelium fungivorum]
MQRRTSKKLSQATVSASRSSDHVTTPCNGNKRGEQLPKSFPSDDIIPWDILPHTILESTLAVKIVQTLVSLGGKATTQQLMQLIFGQKGVSLQRRITSVLSHKNHAEIFIKDDLQNGSGRERALWILSLRETAQTEDEDELREDEAIETMVSFRNNPRYTLKRRLEHDGVSDRTTKMVRIQCGVPLSSQ